MLALRSGPEPLLPAAGLTELAGLAARAADAAATGVPVLLVDRMAARANGVAESPVLIVVDDLQWAGRACLATVQALAARLAGRPAVWALGSRVSPGLPARPG